MAARAASSPNTIKTSAPRPKHPRNPRPKSPARPIPFRTVTLKPRGIPSKTRVAFQSRAAGRPRLPDVNLLPAPPNPARRATHLRRPKRCPLGRRAARAPRRCARRPGRAVALPLGGGRWSAGHLFAAWWLRRGKSRVSPQLAIEPPQQDRLGLHSPDPVLLTRVPGGGHGVQPPALGSEAGPGSPQNAPGAARGDRC